MVKETGELFDDIEQKEPFVLKTVGGFDLFEVVSAFQKTVRRGLEKEALYWAVEMDISNFTAYLWKRIKVISSEDIGLATSTISADINALYQFYMESKKDKNNHKPERLYLIHAVLLLVRASKSRLVDWSLVDSYKDHENVKMVIPDFALDKHTKRGRLMGRGVKHFVEEGVLLSNHKELPGENGYKESAISLLMPKEKE